MSFSTAIDPDTLQAYRETDYQVFAQAPFILRVGLPSGPLGALHQQQGVNCSAFISACNRFSQPLDARSNAARTLGLKTALAGCGLCFLDGMGQHPANHWPGEASVLVMGLRQEAARALAAQYAQNALLWMGAETPVQLILTR